MSNLSQNSVATDGMWVWQWEGLNCVGWWCAGALRAEWKKAMRDQLTQDTRQRVLAQRELRLEQKKYDEEEFGPEEEEEEEEEMTDEDMGEWLLYKKSCTVGLGP